MITDLAKRLFDKMLMTSQRKGHLNVGIDDKKDYLIVNKYSSTQSARLRTEFSGYCYHLSQARYMRLG